MTIAMAATANLRIAHETVIAWTAEFEPRVSGDDAVKRHQFWYSWNDVAAAASCVLDEEFARLKEGVERGTPAVIRSGDIKRKVLAKLLDDAWWKVNGLGKYGIKEL